MWTYLKLAGKQNINPTWKILMKDVDLGEPTSFLDHVYLGCTQRECQTSQNKVDTYRSMYESKISAGAMESCLFREIWPEHFLMVLYRKASILWQFSCFFMVLWYGGSCKEMCTGKLKTVAKNMLWRPPTQGRRLLETCQKVCSQIVLKCLYLARSGGPDILWSVNILARAVTKWTEACDKRLSRLISYIHHTCEYKQ